MWSDTLLAVERALVVRILAWGAMSALVSAVVLMALAARRQTTVLVSTIAVQTAALGLLDILWALVWWRTLAERDVYGSARLADLLRFLTGLTAAITVGGATLATAGWLNGRRMRALGSGVAIAVQGGALLVLLLKTVQRIAALRIA